jgi:hypothetical protein
MATLSVLLLAFLLLLILFFILASLLFAGVPAFSGISDIASIPAVLLLPAAADGVSSVYGDPFVAGVLAFIVVVSHFCNWYPCYCWGAVFLLISLLLLAFLLLLQSLLLLVAYHVGVVPFSLK